MLKIPANLENHPLASMEQIPVMHISKIKNNKNGNLNLLGNIKKSVAIK